MGIFDALKGKPREESLEDRTAKQIIDRKAKSAYYQELEKVEVEKARKRARETEKKKVDDKKEITKFGGVKLSWDFDKFR